MDGKSDYIRREDANDALDDSIRFYEAMSKDYRKRANIEQNDYMDLRDEAARCEQLAGWLNELKVLREKIPYKKPEIINSKNIVPVIRCKGCRHFLPPHACLHDDGMVTAQEDGFCSYSERKK